MGTDKRARQKELSRTRAEQARQEALAAARRKRLVTISLAVIAVGALVGLGLFLSRDDKTNTDVAEGSTGATATGPSTPTGATATGTGATDAYGTGATGTGATGTGATAPETSAAVPPSTTPVNPADQAPCPKADGSSERMTEFKAEQQMCIDTAKKYTAVVDTTMGSFTLALDPAKAPKAVNNFVTLARYHFYDGIIFHRVIKEFVIQGGDPQGTGTGGPGYQFADELPQAGEYKPYSLAMANSGPNTNGSQFFVVTTQSGAAQLGPKYSLFGEAIDGKDVVDKIAATPVDNADKPTTEVKMNKVTITES